MFSLNTIIKFPVDFVHDSSQWWVCSVLCVVNYISLSLQVAEPGCLVTEGERRDHLMIDDPQQAQPDRQHTEIINYSEAQAFLSLLIYI